MIVRIGCFYLDADKVSVVSPCSEGNAFGHKTRIVVDGTELFTSASLDDVLMVLGLDVFRQFDPPELAKP